MATPATSHFDSSDEDEDLQRAFSAARSTRASSSSSSSAAASLTSSNAMAAKNAFQIMAQAAAAHVHPPTSKAFSATSSASASASTSASTKTASETCRLGLAPTRGPFAYEFDIEEPRVVLAHFVQIVSVQSEFVHVRIDDDAVDATSSSTKLRVINVAPRQTPPPLFIDGRFPCVLRRGSPFPELDAVLRRGFVARTSALDVMLRHCVHGASSASAASAVRFTCRDADGDAIDVLSRDTAHATNRMKLSRLDAGDDARESEANFDEIDDAHSCYQGRETLHVVVPHGTLHDFLRLAKDVKSDALELQLDVLVPAAAQSTATATATKPTAARFRLRCTLESRGRDTSRLLKDFIGPRMPAAQPRQDPVWIDCVGSANADADGVVDADADADVEVRRVVAPARFPVSVLLACFHAMRADDRVVLGLLRAMPLEIRIESRRASSSRAPFLVTMFVAPHVDTSALVAAHDSDADAERMERVD